MGLACGAQLGALGCASPSLPLPPPQEPTQFVVDAEHVQLTSACGGADPDAVIVVVNTSPAVPASEAVGGAIADSCGAWSTTVFARVGDYLEITQETGTTQSTPIDVQILGP